MRLCLTLRGIYGQKEKKLMLNVVPFTRDLVFVGGGHAHALVLRAWGMDPLPGARITVINPGPTAPYTGMLPGHVEWHGGWAAGPHHAARESIRRR